MHETMKIKVKCVFQTNRVNLYFCWIIPVRLERTVWTLFSFSTPISSWTISFQYTNINQRTLNIGTKQRITISSYGIYTIHSHLFYVSNSYSFFFTCKSKTYHTSNTEDIDFILYMYQYLCHWKQKQVFACPTKSIWMSRIWGAVRSLWRTSISWPFITFFLSLLSDVV